MGSSSRSRSRSRSKSPIRLDRFGRVIPKGRERSRSPRRPRERERRRSPLVIHLRGRRSRSRSRSSRRSYRSRSPRPRSPRPRSPRRSSSRIHRYSRSRSRSNSRSRSHSTQKERSPGIHGSTNIQDVELMKSRVFIGNLPYDKVTKEELEAMFSKYGKILGISTHERGFGFIQFSKEEEGLEAVKNENGGLLKGFKIDIKMALEGRRGGGAGKPHPRAGPRGSSPGPYADRFAPPQPGGREGHPPPTEDRYPPAAGARRPPPGAPGEGRERSPLRGDPYDDRYRDPYRDPVPPPPRRDDPYYADSYRRPPPPDDPYLDRYRDDPYRYRREPYADPYRDPYYRDYYDAPRKPPPPADVEIILLNGKLKGYGEFIERKLVAKSMTALVSVIPEDSTIPQMMEEASKRGHLFGIVINSQNEVHKSLTLNILHGTPQEHRNMPVDDALTLVGRSFETYMQTAREKTAAAAPPPERGAPPPPPTTARAPPPFLPPGPDITYLLNLLADNRQLTIEEIDKVIGYLRERRDKLYETEGRRPPEAGYNVGDIRKEDNSLQQQQQELQAKILSILNGPGDSGAPQAPKPGPGVGMGNGAPAGGSSQSGMSSLINFDNPHVQKALDNLIQSGPNLLKNISSTPGIKPVGVGIMSREGEPMRREVGGGGYGGLAGNAPMQQHGQVGGQGGMGGLQQVQRPMYGSVPSAAPPRPGAPGQGMRRY